MCLQSIPKLDVPMDKLAQMSYQETAYEVMKPFPHRFYRRRIEKLHQQEPMTINLIQRRLHRFMKQTEYISWSCSMELPLHSRIWHLSILPHLMTTAAKKNNVKNEIVILTATSGDTGKAAMAGFADVPGTRIIVFYPKNGVSPIQEKQMVTQKGDNTYVVGITGNFDDAQTAVKKMFNDQELAAELDQAGYQFSSANSINIGRLVPQIVYYVYAYASLVTTGKIKAWTGDQCYSSYRKLWKYSCCILCKADGTSDP